MTHGNELALPVFGRMFPVQPNGSDQPGLPGAVFWDMDGTLVDTEPLWDIALERWTAWLGIGLTEQLRESMMGNSMPNALSCTSRVPEDDRDYRGDAQWLRSQMSELFAAGIPWCAGAQRALDHVAGLGIPMVLVTNTERVLADVALTVIGRGRFTTTVCGDEVPEGKPAPDIYLRAAQLVGLQPAQALAVEDSPTGVAAATAAGCPTLVVSGRSGSVQDGPLRMFRDGIDGLATMTSALPGHGRLVSRENVRGALRRADREGRDPSGQRHCRRTGFGHPYARQEDHRGGRRGLAGRRARVRRVARRRSVATALLAAGAADQAGA